MTSRRSDRLSRNRAAWRVLDARAARAATSRASMLIGKLAARTLVPKACTVPSAPVHPQCRQYLGRRERDVQEEANRVVNTKPTQRRPERYHVIVVDPQNVVGLERGSNTLGEHL